MAAAGERRSNFALDLRTTESQSKQRWLLHLVRRTDRGRSAQINRPRRIQRPADQAGTIEAGYSILEAYQQRGIGSEATRAIMQWAFRNPAIRRIDAETFPGYGTRFES